jgi:hypothetical protein
MAPSLSPLASRLLLGSWLSQLLLAGLIALVAPIPVRPLVIERRFCSESQRNAMLARYQTLVLRDRLGIERFRSVIFYLITHQAPRLREGRPKSLDLTSCSALSQEECRLSTE